MSLHLWHISYPLFCKIPSNTSMWLIICLQMYLMIKDDFTNVLLMMVLWILVVASSWLYEFPITIIKLLELNMSIGSTGLVTESVTSFSRVKLKKIKHGFVPHVLIMILYDLEFTYPTHVGF